MASERDTDGGIPEDFDLEVPLRENAEMAAAFGSELQRMRRAFGEVEKDARALERGLSRGLRRAMSDVAIDGESLADVLESVGRSMLRSTFNAAVKPVTDHAAGVLTRGVETLIADLLPFAKGAAFSQGKVMPFARGGVVAGPTVFPMSGGLGLMGEAGPEAILPLARGVDGALGVRSAGQKPVTVVMNVTTPDVDSFHRSQGQIAAQMSRLLSRGQRYR